MDQFLSTFHTRKIDRSGRHLELMNELLALFEIRLDDFKWIQITGSCGKGSTASLLSEILVQAHIRHGLFVGPHLFGYEDRFSIDGRKIASAELAQLVTEIAERIETYPHKEEIGHMHIMVLISLLYFGRNGIELVVFENGVGGQSDPSNVFTPLIAVVTEITLDHLHLLGGTIEEITANKLAIIKDDTKFAVIGTRDVIARRSILERFGQDERVFFVDRDFVVQKDAATNDIRYTGIQLALSNLTIGLQGDHQLQNAATALAVCELLRTCGYLIEEAHISAGLEKCHVPGRLDFYTIEGKQVIVDGAHNDKELAALSDFLLRRYEKNRLHFLLSFASNKEIPKLLEKLSGTGRSISVVPSPFVERRIPYQELEAAFLKKDMPFAYYEELEQAFSSIVASLSQDDVLVVTGSMYLVGEVLKLIKRRYA